MDQVQEVKQALNASSETATLDELRARGRKKVKVVRAEQIAQMIAEAVQRALQASGLLSKDEHEKLVERSRDEFKSVIKQREEEVAEARRAASEAQGLREQLEVANQRAAEMRTALEAAQAGEGQAGAGAGGAAAAGDTAGLAALMDKLTGTLNERLDKFGRKMGISSAVDAGDVKLDGLFNQDLTEGLESNMDDVQVKKKTVAGIADNLAKLKKLKGDG